jgi:hypothetical protein
MNSLYNLCLLPGDKSLPISSERGLCADSQKTRPEEHQSITIHVDREIHAEPIG